LTAARAVVRSRSAPEFIVVPRGYVRRGAFAVVSASAKESFDVAAEEITITKAQGFELLEALDVAVEIAVANDDLPNRVRFEDVRAILLDAIFPDLPDAE
jgi:hypothetical protein